MHARKDFEAFTNRQKIYFWILGCGVPWSRNHYSDFTFFGIFCNAGYYSAIFTLVDLCSLRSLWLWRNDVVNLWIQSTQHALFWSVLPLQIARKVSRRIWCPPFSLLGWFGRTFGFFCSTTSHSLFCSQMETTIPALTSRIIFLCELILSQSATRNLVLTDIVLLTVFWCEKKL